MKSINKNNCNCEVCKEKIEDKVLYLDDMKVCSFCFNNSIESDSYGIQELQLRGQNE